MREMKRTFIASIMILFLLLPLAAEMQPVSMTKANPSSWVWLHPDFVVTVQSPLNQTYRTNTIPLNITVETYSPSTMQFYTYYSLNNETTVILTTPIVSEKILTGHYGSSDGKGGWINNTYNYARYTAQGSVLLSNLTDGNYNLTLKAIGYYHRVIYFTVDTNPASTYLLSPENVTYNKTAVPLTIFTNESLLETSYSIDNKASVTLTENTTISGLVNGSHHLTVYEKSVDAIKSATIFFNVSAQSLPSLSPSAKPTISPNETPLPEINASLSEPASAILPTIASSASPTKQPTATPTSLTVYKNSPYPIELYIEATIIASAFIIAVASVAVYLKKKR